MKKILIPLLLITLIISGCTTIEGRTETTTSETGESIHYYVSEKLGLKLQQSKWKNTVDGELKGELKEEDNRIIYTYEPWGEEYFEYITIFEKDENENIEDAILDIIATEGKDQRDCQVISQEEAWEDKKFKRYIIDLKDPDITYSQEELIEIEKSEENAKIDGGPFNGDWKKQEIYNTQLVEECSFYAEPLGLATCKTQGARFLYDEKNKPTKFIFLPENNCEGSFYDVDADNTFEFLKK